MTVREQLSEALKSSLQNRYLLANCFYVAYASAMLIIDYALYPSYLDASSSDPDKANEIYALINRCYLGFGVLHAINSVQYYWSWLPSGYRWHHRVMVPEYLNMMGAAIYLYTATRYPECNDTLSDITLHVHHWETVASAIELVAAFGWVYTWWLVYPRGVPGRGWTLDDPDVWGWIFIIIPSIVYFAYNLQILANPDQYGSNFLYCTGDVLYFVGSIFYLLAALRDDGWFWFMPTAGALPNSVDSKQPYAPEDLVFPDEEGDDTDEGLSLLSPGGTATGNRRRRDLAWFCSACLGCGCPRNCCRRRTGAQLASPSKSRSLLVDGGSEIDGSYIVSRETSVSMAAMPSASYGTDDDQAAILAGRGAR
jgi:hypothetical protein